MDRGAVALPLPSHPVSGDVRIANPFLALQHRLPRCDRALQLPAGRPLAITALRDDADPFGDKGWRFIGSDGFSGRRGEWQPQRRPVRAAGRREHLLGRLDGVIEMSPSTTLVLRR